MIPWFFYATTARNNVLNLNGINKKTKQEPSTMLARGGIFLLYCNDCQKKVWNQSNQGSTKHLRTNRSGAKGS